MSSDEEDALMDSFDKWDQKHAKQEFLARMQHKLHRKEHSKR